MLSIFCPTAVHLTKTVALVAVLTSLLTLTGCDDTDLSSPPLKLDNTDTFTPLSPNTSLNYGRESAIFHHLSQTWKLSEINHIPVEGNVILDFTKIDQGKALVWLSKKCQPISVQFDTSNISRGELSIINIQRQLTDCSTQTEDDLMMILADTRYLERDTLAQNKLVLGSYQDTLTLIPNP